MCNFTVAVNRKRKVQGQPDADFFRVAAWGHLGENCQKYLSKGRKVAVCGAVSVSTYTGNDNVTRANLEVFAEDVEFINTSGGNAQAESTPAPAQEHVSEPGGFTPVTTEDLPF